MTSHATPVQGLFITGTDTGVGKTSIGAAIVRRWHAQGRRVGAYKPVASGCETGPLGEAVWGDVEAYHAALNGEFPRERICPQQFSAPLAPPVAARREGRSVDDNLIISGATWWTAQVEVLVVEGAGGLLSPVSDVLSNADLAKSLGLGVLIVARLGLGTINHTLLTVEAAERRGLRIRGIVLNAAQPTQGDQSVDSNPDELARRCSAPILGVLPYSPDGDLLHHPAFLRMMNLL